MNQQLENQFNAFEQKRKGMIEELRKLGAQKLHEQPQGKWSAIQNINHLILAEMGTLMYLKKKIQGADSLKNSGVKNWFAYQLVWFYTYLPLKVKAPKGLDNPSNEENLDELDAKWDKVRANWKEFVSQVPEKQLELAIFKHPLLSPRLNISQTIGFCEAHFLRHKRQIKRTLR
jgi:hypothetical protein